jgi:cysteine-rich repeat protein
VLPPAVEVGDPYSGVYSIDPNNVISSRQDCFGSTFYTLSGYSGSLTISCGVGCVVPYSINNDAEIRIRRGAGRPGGDRWSLLSDGNIRFGISFESDFDNQFSGIPFGVPDSLSGWTTVRVEWSSFTATGDVLSIPAAAAICGNGILEHPPETCDDGGMALGDGCSDICEVEPGFICTGSPSVCTQAVPAMTPTGYLLLGTVLVAVGVWISERCKQRPVH